MKSKIKTLYSILLLMLFLFNPVIKMFGQDKVNLSLGIGFTECLNIGIKYQILDQAKIGLNMGWFPATKGSGSLLSFQGNFYYHLFGSSKFSELHPWYGRTGLGYLREDLSEYVNWWYSYLRFGRDFYLSKKIGIGADAGLYYHFNPEKTGNFRFGPTLGGCFFYRFIK